MLILALEQSTAQAGLALLRDGVIIAEQSWEEPRKRDQHLFAALPRLLETGDTDAHELDRIAVGLGPGSFSGVRIAIAAASALALPDHRPIAGIGSAAALAWTAVQQNTAKPITVVGDARRKRLWMVSVEHGHRLDEQLIQNKPRLIEKDALKTQLPAGSLILTSDWDRLAETLIPLADDGWIVPNQPHYPTASAVAQLAATLPTSSLFPPLTPPAPLYLHPAVFVPPRTPT